jgi:hypothetical protein
MTEIGDDSQLATNTTMRGPRNSQGASAHPKTVRVGECEREKLVGVETRVASRGPSFGIM